MSDHLTSDAERGDAKSAAKAEARSNWERALLEKAVLASVCEQRAARRWKIFFRFLFLSLFALIVGRLVFFSGDKSSTNVKHTALVTLEGEIAANSQASADSITAALEAAFASRNAVGVILRINSPGGSPVQAGIINQEIRRLRNRYSDKPLYVVVDDICASGGYYVAVAADKIFVDKASLIGSIGVRMDNFGFTGLMQKLGVERRSVTAGENKNFFDPFSPEVPKHREYAQAMLKEIHQQFITTVEQGRGKRLKENPEIFSGLVWTGQRSIELGLADALGDSGYVAREVLKAEQIVDYTVKESFVERLARKFGMSAGTAAARLLGGDIALKLSPN